MSADDVEEQLVNALRRVAPAINVYPDSIDIPPGLFRRARRRRSPALLALGGPDSMLVVLSDPLAVDAALVDYATAAFEAIPQDARSACEDLIVGWPYDGRMRVAVFKVRESGPLPDPIATSWTNSSSWSTPTIDGALRGEQAILSALDKLSAAMASGSPNTVDRAVEVVGLELRVQGGEPVDAVPPLVPVGAEVRERWLTRYRRAVHSEWRRATGRPGSATDAVQINAARSGPLQGWKVFVSYARPDAVTLAWPVCDALAEAGAAVWLDQAENPDPQLLDAGLADLIAGCDAYVACVSNEFFERAGYATQEMAWALERSDGSQAHLLVTKPSTLLPKIVAHWPAVPFDGTPRFDLTRPLVNGLLGDNARRPVLLPPAQVLSPVPDDELDTRALRRRARHVQRFLDVSQEQVQAIAVGMPQDRRAEVARQVLLDPGAGLDWSGHLDDIADWPADSLVRDMRWRLGVMRVIASVQWPLSGSLDQPTDIAHDMDRMLTYPHPALEWPSVVGWADDERRLAVRYQAGLLRVLEQLLKRGLDGGLLNEPEKRIDAWAALAVERRQECLDALVDLRLRGRLGWQAERPIWDSVYQHLMPILRESRSEWNDAVPGPVDALLRALAADVAAAAAETFWVFARTGETSTWRIQLNGKDTTHLLIWAGWNVPAEPAISLGLTPGRDGGVEFLVSWPDPSSKDVRRARVRDPDFSERIRFTR